MNTEKIVKIAVGNRKIILNEDILRRLDLLRECGYMKKEFDKIIDMIIEIWNNNCVNGETIKAEESMMIISTLKQAQNDYEFLTSLIVEKEDDDVLEEKEEVS